MSRKDQPERAPASPLAHLLDRLSAGDAPDEGLVEAIKSALYGVAHAPRAIERAAGLLLWHHAWQATAEKPKRGGDRRSAAAKRPGNAGENQTLQLAGFDRSTKWSAFDLAAAEALSCDPSTIYRDRMLAEALGAEAIKRLWNTSIADNAAALKKFTKFSATAQLGLFSVWESEPDLDFSDAVKRLRLGSLSPDAELLSRFRQLWDRMGSGDRREALLYAAVSEEATEAAVRKWQRRAPK